MRRTISCALIVVIGICFIPASKATAGLGDYLFAKGKGLDLMKNGAYADAISELKKVESRQDLEVQLALIECYLMLGTDTAANKKAEAVIKNPSYENASDQIASVYLRSLRSTSNQYFINYRLRQLDRYAVSENHKKKVGEYEKLLSKSFQGKYRKDLLERAAMHLGSNEVYGFEKIQIDPNKHKIVFYTDQPVTLIDKWKKGSWLKFSGVPKDEKLMMEENGTFYPVPMDFSFEAQITAPLILKYKKGGEIFVTIPYAGSGIKIGKGVGFEAVYIDEKTVKVIFHTENRIKITEFNKDDKYSFLEVSDLSAIKRYYPDLKESYPLKIGQGYQIRGKVPLILEGKPGGYVVIKSWSEAN